MARDSESRSRAEALNLLAACGTGALVIGLLNPLDCVKQRWQVASSREARTTLVAFSRRLVQHEGLWYGLWWPGLVSNCLACSISVGARLGIYPKLRDRLLGAPGAGTGADRMFFSGLVGGAVGYVAAAPLFYATRVAQAEAGVVGADGRLLTGARAGRPPTAAGASGLPMLRALAASRGVVGLWKGADVLVARGALMSATQLATYDLAKKRMLGAGLVDGPLVHSLASVCASLTLTTAICPLDVVLTRYQADVARTHSSASAAAAALVREGGPRALMRGWTPLWLRFLPSSVLTFHIYEQSRRLLLGSYLD